MRRPLALVLLVHLVACSVVSSAQQDGLPSGMDECTQMTLAFVGGCQDLSTEGSNPSNDCCLGLNMLKQQSPVCLCKFLQDSTNETSGWYTPFHSKLLQAPKLCGVPHGVSDCPAILGLSPASPDAMLFKVQPATASSQSSLSPSSSPLSSPSFPSPPKSFSDGLPPTGDSYSKGVGIHNCRLGTVVSFIMGVAVWILA